MIRKRSTFLERSVKSIFTEGLNQFHSADLTLYSDVDLAIDIPNIIKITQTRTYTIVLIGYLKC